MVDLHNVWNQMEHNPLFLNLIWHVSYLIASGKMISSGLWILSESPGFSLQTTSFAPLVEVLCMLLCRFTYPNHYGDLSEMFGHLPDEISWIVSQISVLLYSNYEHVLKFDDRCLTAGYLEQLAKAVHRKGAPLWWCWGFIDGTVRAICQPEVEQRQVYNGHKHIHALKFQSVITPNGIIVHLSGPWVGRHHDARMLKESNLLEIISTHANGTDGEAMQLYGDLAYGVHWYLLSPFYRA